MMFKSTFEHLIFILSSKSGSGARWRSETDRSERSHIRVRRRSAAGTRMCRFWNSISRFQTSVVL